MLRADVPPEVEHDLVVRLELDGLAQREEDREPGEHARGVCGGEDADHNLLVQLALKVAAESMQHRVSNCCEAQFSVPENFLFLKESIFLIVPCIVDNLVPVWMVEGEEGLWCGQFKPILKVDDIGGFKVGQGVLRLVLALAHFIVQLRALGRKAHNETFLFVKLSPEAGPGRMCTHMG